MSHSLSSVRTPVIALARYLVVSLLMVSVLSLAGCGGTKVYTTSKTIVYKDSTYVMSNVQRIGSRVEANIATDDVRNMRNMDKKAVEGLLEEHAPMMVSMVVEMDSQEMVYQRKKISKYSEYSSMLKRFERANSDINKFLADKKKTQLKLK